MKKVMLVFGTRPEAIKMCPLVKEFQKRADEFETIVCVTGQHREMLDQVLKIFEVTPDIEFMYSRNIKKFSGISYKKDGVRTLDNRYSTKREYIASTQTLGIHRPAGKKARTCEFAQTGFRW